MLALLLSLFLALLFLVLHGLAHLQVVLAPGPSASVVALVRRRPGPTHRCRLFSRRSRCEDRLLFGKPAPFPRVPSWCLTS
ncbi:hypothetical protein DFH11DRAFT_1591717 [Phellopilus nigrolimitatus]|nr:hypothetical protein DFH11DRAFT_1591717 [Phellopilus nigrolimitatus]